MVETPWRRRIGTAPKTWVTLMAVAAVVLGWLPFLRRPLSPDEGGFLLVGAQWVRGSSLYGDLWVDRPPFIIAIFRAAEALGGQVPLRLFGALAVVLSVVLAGVLGRMAAPERRSAPLLAAGAAAAFVANPLFDSGETNGEVLALPFVIAGLAAYVAASASRSAQRAVVLALASGACTALAVMVKQSQVDVLVAAVVLALTSSQARRQFPAFLAGTVVTGLAVVWLASLRGTNPDALWDAVVTFRLDAAGALAQHGGQSPIRFLQMMGALFGSALPFLVAAFVWKGRGRPSRQGPWTAPDLRPAAYVLLAAEVAIALLAGNYWLHYLVALVPGVVLVAAAFAQRPAPVTRSIGISFALAALSTLVSVTVLAVNVRDLPGDEAVSYLSPRVADGDTGVVVLGNANIIRQTGLEPAPYPYLWSLPARVRDPDLTDLTSVISGPGAPTWVVVYFASLKSWGIDSADLRAALDAGYEQVGTPGKLTVFRRSR